MDPQPQPFTAEWCAWFNEVCSQAFARLGEAYLAALPPWAREQAALEQARTQLAHQARANSRRHQRRSKMRRHR